MKTEIKIHPIQASSLRVLLFKLKARFSELNIDKVPNDQFNFHVKQLLEQGLIEKNESGVYQLTPMGKEFANRFDTDTNKVERQAKCSVCICCIKYENNQRYYLMNKRLKQPFYGFHGFITGKVRWGESVFDAAGRELLEETGLTTDNMKLMHIKHKIDVSENREVLEDKYFYSFLATDLKGDLLEEFEGGRNFWATKEELYNLPDLFDGIEDGVEGVDRKEFIFLENEYVVKGF